MSACVYCPVCGHDGEGGKFFATYKLGYIKHLRDCIPMLGITEAKDLAERVLEAATPRLAVMLTVAEIEYLQQTPNLPHTIASACAKVR